MTNVYSKRVSATQSHRILANSRKIYYILIVCCAALLPAAFAKGYLDVSGGEASSSAKSEDDQRNRAPEIATDILQLQPHPFRHQEHYSQRIEQAVNDFKRAQQHQLEDEVKSSSKNDANETVSNNIKNKRLQQIKTAQQQEEQQTPQKHHQQQQQQQQQKEQQQSLQQHHRRHEQHLQHLQQQQRQRQLQFQREQMQQHHLRHHNRHHEAWEQRVFPTMRQQPQHHRFSIAATTESAVAPIDIADEQTGNELDAAKLLRASSATSSSSLQQRRYFDRDSLFSSGGGGGHTATTASAWTRTTRAPRLRHTKLSERAFGDAASQRTSSLSGRRITLKLSGYGASDGGQSEDQSDDDYSDDEDDNYDDDVDDMVDAVQNTTKARAANEFPNSEKTSVKRYSNPFKLSHKTAAQQIQIHAKSINNNSDDDEDGDYDDDEANDDDSDAENGDFSRSKWHKIEHDHRLRQLQHQRELQELRAKHGNNFFPADYQHQTVKNNENDDDIYSRNYIPGTLTRQKQMELGTPEAIQSTRRALAMSQKQNRALAQEHAKQIYGTADCRIPQRRVERIQREHSKIYTPHCTVLHRCADDTGCCRSDRQTCAPKRTKSVDMYFFVNSVNDRNGAIERLTFVNHTECHCVDKASLQWSSDAANSNDNARRLLLLGADQRHATILNCNCPKLYEKILQEDGQCRCDCSSGNTGCDWLKRGMEHFSMIDRKCILEGRCKPPTCAYGAFVRRHGRCPRREEQLTAALTTNELTANGGYH